jgi:hypothetical protein
VNTKTPRTPRILFGARRARIPLGALVVHDGD